MRSIDYYNEAKKTNSLNDADMARLLGVTTAAIAHAKKANHFSVYIAVRCAEIAGLSEKDAAAIAGAEAEHVPAKRDYLLRKLVGMAASVAFVSVNLFLTLAPPSTEVNAAEKNTHSLYYVK